MTGGVFLTGAAARLPDLCDVAERVLECQARFGLPLGIVDWPDELDDPEWSTAAGLAMYSAKLKAQAGGSAKRRLAGKNFYVRGRWLMGLIDSDMRRSEIRNRRRTASGARIKVIGVGGGGCNAVARMVQEGLRRRGVLRHEHRRAGADAVRGAQQAAARRQDH